MDFGQSGRRKNGFKKFSQPPTDPLPSANIFSNSRPKKKSSYTPSYYHPSYPPFHTSKPKPKSSPFGGSCARPRYSQPNYYKMNDIQRAQALIPGRRMVPGRIYVPGKLRIKKF